MNANIKQADRTHWQPEDVELDTEHKSVLTLVRESEDVVTPSPSLDRKVRQLARQRIPHGPEHHWILGQGPRLILVTLIMFAIAMAVLLSF